MLCIVDAGSNWGVYLARRGWGENVGGPEMSPGMFARFAPGLSRSFRRDDGDCGF